MPPKVIHVCGFGWSGSSAVADALLDTHQFLSLKGKSSSVSESRIFGGRTDIPSFIARTPKINPHDVIALWTNGTRTGRTDSLSPRVKSFVTQTKRSHEINSKFLRKIELKTLRQGAESVVAALEDASTPDERRSAYIRETYKTIQAAFGASGLSILIDNDPSISPQISLHLEQENVHFVAVIRSPSDAYVDRRRVVNPNESTVRDVMRTSLAAWSRLRELRSLAQLVHQQHPRLIVVEFERFVSDDQYRQSVLESIIGGDGSRVAGERFNPTHSQQNIGLLPRRRDLLARSIFAATLSRVQADLARECARSVSGST